VGKVDEPCYYRYTDNQKERQQQHDIQTEQPFISRLDCLVHSSDGNESPKFAEHLEKPNESEDDIISLGDDHLVQFLALTTAENSKTETTFSEPIASQDDLELRDLKS
jgi:hypothetical protein